MVAYGVRCNIGDQLHPNGQMNADTYRLIGNAYRYVESIEDYIEGGTTCARLGLMLPSTQEAREGYAKLLSDAHFDYRVVAAPDDLSPYDCILLPSPIRLTAEQERALCDFSERGGKLVLFGKPDGAENLLEKIGYTDLGASEFDTDYIRYTAASSQAFSPRRFLCTMRHTNLLWRASVLRRFTNPSSRVPRDITALTETHPIGKRRRNILLSC